MSKSMLVNIVQRVNAKEIRTEMVGNEEYIVLPSKTQPRNVVMNGLMYPEAQTDAKIETLNGKPAPIDHPIINGKYIDATDAVAALNFGAGVNKVTSKDKETGAWNVEKWVNKEILENTKRGKRLMKAINEGRPIHTSTGVYLNTVPNSAGSNEYGDYEAEVEIVEFNHDSILPDSTGANTPEKGTGIFVNSEGEEVEVVTINLSSDTGFNMSSNAVREKLEKALYDKFKNPADDNFYIWVEDFNENVVIYNQSRETKSIGYSISDGEITLIGEPREVERKSYYQFNQDSFLGKFVTRLANMVKSDSNIEPNAEVDTMSQLLKEQLTKLEVNFAEDATEADLLTLYTEAVVNKATVTDEDINRIVDQKIKANQALAEKSEKEELVKLIENSGMTEEELMELPLKALKAMQPQTNSTTHLPKPRVNTEENSDHELDLNAMMEGK